MDYWREQKLDFVVMPGLGSQALEHGRSKDTSLSICYTLIWNMLDMVVGSMPVTRVLPHEQSYTSKHNDLVANSLKENAKKSEGMPVGVQIVGAPFQEEEVLGLMSSLEKKINFYQKNPLPKL